MHIVTALFDAPVPARGALAALLGVGVAREDVAVVPLAPGAEDFVRDLRGDRLPSDAPALRAALEALGVDAADARAYSEGVRRGGILVVVTVPTLSAPIVRAALDRFAAVDLAAHEARWVADADLRYTWAVVPPPILAAGR